MADGGTQHARINVRYAYFRWRRYRAGLLLAGARYGAPMTLTELASTARSGSRAWISRSIGMSARELVVVVLAVVAFQFCDDVLWRAIDFLIDHVILPHIHWLHFLADN